MKPAFTINGHDYAPYILHKTGIAWSRENTNDEDAGRDTSETMHPMVTSHQRKLTITMGKVPFEIAQQLEKDLEGNDDGVKVYYPDIKDGMCTRLFYNTSIEAAEEEFTEDSVIVNNIKFSLISVKEATV